MANNQMVNFNSQDVANMYRRNQLANALQERMNAPTPVHTYQGFQAPVSPLTGISKALDIYSVMKNEQNQEDKYQAEKAAAEQKAQNLINKQNEQATEFGKQFNPVVTEQMIGGNTSFTPTQYADAINAYGKPQEPTQASDMLNGEPTTYGRNEGTLQTTSTPRTRQEIMGFESQGVGSNNPQINRMAENSRQSRIADETAKAIIEKDSLIRKDKLTDYGTQLADQEKIDTRKNDRAVEAATTEFGRNKILEGIKSSPGSAKSTEGERTAAFLSKRLENSLSQLKLATGGDSTANSPNMLASTLKYVTNSDYFKNLANPESRQQVEAAQLDILDAALTLGTGAAYTKEQLEGYRQSYFPQLGDRKGTIKDKEQRLQNVLDAARIKAGSALQKNSGNNPPIKLSDSPEPMFASNGTSRITSTDGGKTWKEVK